MNPLVTITVFSYNSAAFVQETLESAYNQTYSNLALVVSDDCSKDNSLAIVQEWLAQERVKDRFQSIKVLTVAENTGVSANCNRCIAAAPSDWIKFLAGDDILLPNAIQDYMQFVHDVPQAQVVFAQVKVYQDTFEEKNYVRTTPLDYPYNLMDQRWSAKDQYEILLVQDRIHYTPAVFFNKQAVLRVGGYDEEHRLAEDYPMWLKLTRAGERLYYLHKPTAGYRIHYNAANNTGQEVLFKPSALYTFEIRKRVAHRYLPWEMVASEYHVYCITRWFQQFGWNKKQPFYQLMYRLGCFYLNPFHYIYSLKKRMPAAKNNHFYN